ncbi:MAG: ABC transporter substrate-binding protein, partial [Candidatus Rokubacteria bacterium]|nr:ABC transporter substrate-binding protein [Candidatus Rokubacteria bacterium]
MRRRALALVVGLAATILAASLAAEAQQAGKVYRIGLLFSTPPATGGHLWKALLQGLRDLGYVEGRNLVIE